MKIPFRHIIPSLNRTIFWLVLLTVFAVRPMYAQIVIGGSVYGGGNAGNTGGSTKVTVYSGDLHAVFAGARMANVGGSAFVHIDGKQASDYILADYVYGGNDIAGTIGTSKYLPKELTDTVENKINNTWNAFVRISSKTTTGDEIPNNAKIYIGQLFGGGNGYYDYKTTTSGTGPSAVTTYTVEDKHKTTDKEVASSNTPLSVPELGKTYLEILGGSIVYAYGGGNNATVTEKTIVCLDNPSKVVGSIKDTRITTENDGELLTNARFELMRIDTTFNYPNSEAFQIGRLFGGNNKADMAIRPRWNLKRGSVRNLYGGGNEGRMTSPEGLLLQIEGAEMTVDNVYGGCRKADVRPLYDNNEATPVAAADIQLDPTDNPNNIPGGYAARVRVLDGHVSNVYGGNDISGNVYGGNTVGIFTRIYGNVYGGGNGSYAYTDNPAFKSSSEYGDFYYNVDSLLKQKYSGWKDGDFANLDSKEKGLKSAEALNLFRPNAERVSILVRGTEEKPVFVEGALYVGGNSASLREQTTTSESGTNMTHIKIGSYVTIDKVFLGNNGENMVKYNEADSEGKGEGVLRTLRSSPKAPDGNPAKFSQMDLTDKDVFEKYMEGCAMKVKPNVLFESKSRKDPLDYISYTTYIGSFYCGGNVGSIFVPGKITVDFEDKLIVYDKVVGGCNNANVNASAYNAEYLGGLLGDPDPVPDGSPKGAIGDKLELNFAGLKIQPKRWDATYEEYTGDALVVGDTYYTSNLGDGEFVAETTTKESGVTYYKMTSQGTELIWNTYSASTGLRIKPTGLTAPTTSTPGDLDRRFKGGNIYGGCYSSGHVNGNVIINVNKSIVDRVGDYAVFDSISINEGEAILYNNESYQIVQRRSGVILDEQGMDVLGKALNIFGGGYGYESEIWGSTTINLNAGYMFQIFGGGEQGSIGEPVNNGNYTFTYKKNGQPYSKKYNYDSRYSCYINVKGKHVGTYRADKDDSDGVIDDGEMAEAEFIYGGGFFGPIAGNTQINLGNGRIFNTFAGSCNADILGHTETYVGRQPKDDGTGFESGFPWVRDHIYGGNDLGGRILANGGTNGDDINFKSRVRTDKIKQTSADTETVLSKVYNPKKKENPDVLKASAYIEYQQGRVDYIFGGCYGYYDYTDPHFKDYTYTRTPVKNEQGEITSYIYTDDGSDKDNVGQSKSGFIKPRMESAFVNFRPVFNSRNAVSKIYGAGQGYSGEIDRDVMQDRSYVLVDIPQNHTNFLDMEVFGAGDYSGVGMRNSTNDPTPVLPNHPLTPAIAQTNEDGVTASAVIDLVRGQIYAAYGASYKEGFTRRTILNVPTGSTIDFKRIFGGAYGLKNDVVCDVYDANINYLSGDAVAQGDQTVDADWRTNETTGEREFMSGAIFGGNNSYGRTLYSKINIRSAVVQDKVTGYSSRVFGGGYGSGSWSQYTEVNLLNGASVYEVYGGGYGGKVYNTQTVKAWQLKEDEGLPEGAPSNLPLDLGEGYKDEGLNCYLVKTNPLGKKTNTNVYINKGSTVWGYCYGGGLGAEATVSGTTYIGLHGGTVKKDLYAGGWGGAVAAEYNITGDITGDEINDAFTAEANAFIEGGTVRNVYGGGYEGAVGKHTGAEVDGKFLAVAGSTEGDRPGRTNVVIGIRKDQNLDFTSTDLFPNGYGFYKGIPAIERNAYSGGEGGSVFGSATLTINNGYIGYRFFKTEPQDNIQFFTDGNGEGRGYYQEKIHDETYGSGGNNNRLADCGNAFGAGYDDKSSVDFTNVIMYGGRVRSSIYGGGEIATVGRGKTKVLSGVERGLEEIYMAGGTHIEMYNGIVQRNVFGGGKGYNILGYGGTNELYTDGYVFGQTEVYIHGGVIGTEDGLAKGYGNVFGGGDVGFIFSKGYFNEASRHTGTTSPNHHYYYYSDSDKYKCTEEYSTYKVDDEISESVYKSLSADDKKHWEQKDLMLTEDCKVIISPMLQVRPGPAEKPDKYDVLYNSHTYHAYDYVPTDYLNTLKSKDKDTRWKGLFCGDGTETIDPEDKEERGVHIFNGVFGGGNVSSNSDKTYANATTVFGNTTATLYDVYHRDFITVGTEHTGGLYGGGNLSVVDGYRELNITNYGTDYYGLDTQISLAAYRDSLTNRERAYFQLEYLCNTTYTVGDKTYTKDVSRISEDDYEELPSDEKDKWDQYGFCSIYAGRLLNTIQRADLCGVFGSRMVLQGAVDRVADIGDKTEYTINRIGELSLNKQKSIAGDTDDKAEHGNYFGIYSVVNYLGNLTSDVKFSDNYLKWNNTNKKGEEVIKSGEEKYTYYNWKEEHLKKRDRNNGTCHNQVALASGVFLELTTENSTQTKKDYGYITGIVELDLINVKKDIEGGGYVYAKNEHGYRTEHSEYQNVILSPYNMKNIAAGREYEARTYKRYTYYEYEAGSETENKNNILDLETSGNFIHKTKRIVDDCFPNNGAYRDGYVASPAHYWYIKGEVYIYDQVISAYAGSATAYHKEVKIPLTITAGSDGKLQLLNVQPNLYAYYTSSTDRTEDNKIGQEGVKVNFESEVYQLNEVISWWDWHQLSSNEQKYFVKETFVNVDTCYVDGDLYPAGTYVLENDSTVHNGDADATAYKVFMAGSHTITNVKGVAMTIDDVFHPSNNISHNNGYVLTFEMDSPKDWDKWYSPVSGNSIYTGEAATTTRKQKDNLGSSSENYREGPTFKLTGTPALYGQRDYVVSDIIAKEVYTDYTTTIGEYTSTLTDEEKAAWEKTQAVVEPAYVALADMGAIQKGSSIPKSTYEELTDKSNYASAMVCTSSIRLGVDEYLLQGELVSASDESLNDLADKYMAYNNSQTNIDKINQAEALEYVRERLSEAYFCKTAGKYGGQYFKSGINYSALKTWCSLSDDRDEFTFNYDALDVLTAPTYPGEGQTKVYDGNDVNSPLYSAVKPVEYMAVNNGTSAITYYLENDPTTPKTVGAGKSISRDEFEQIINEKKHYTRIEVKKKTADSETLTVYIAKENFTDHGTPYGEGQDISEKDYNNLLDVNKLKTAPVTINRDATDKVWYYCYKGYGDVKADTIIDYNTFRNLKNYQEPFTIQGSEPTETTTLYVSRESNAKDVTSEKIISVVYQYTYYEEDDEGEGISLVNELHVVNIHLQLESGAPEIGPLSPPATVLPGDKLRLKAPSVNPGLYEIITNGWEMFTDESDAEMHRNGVPFTNNMTPVYWYQNEKRWVAFYSKTYLGKTYSDPVVVTVANYHDLDAVMKDKEHHLYVDHPDVMRNSKIYIDNRDCQSDAAKSELDLLKDFFDLSLIERAEGLTTEDTITQADHPFKGHTLLNSRVKGGAKLEFILNSNVSPKKYIATKANPTGTWTSIGDESLCFMGNLHGDGYTVSGLDNSLFGKLCGNVYNLGVTGSFTSSGVADSGGGRVENCWINTSATTGFSGKAVFGSNDGTLVNSYYPSTKAYTEGAAYAMDTTAFYNGTVAYNLNGFYLNKRYNDGRKLGTGTEYKYLKNNKGTLSSTLQTGYYPTGTNTYVESRYGNVDFTYSGGSIPESNDSRLMHTTVIVDNAPKDTLIYVPIYPDDYMFFGQKLTYDTKNGTHQDWPTRITKSSGMVDVSSYSTQSNRVCRAPAYFRSSTMGVAHFNIGAVIPAKSKPISPTDDTMKDAYPGMTAIDFAGHEEGMAATAYKEGYDNNNMSLFYQPLLDDEGLGSIDTYGQTPNLLVYAPAATAKEGYSNEATYDVLNDHFSDEPRYSDYDESSNKYFDGVNYNRVAKADASVVAGHLVQATLTDDKPTATNDHLLVDKQEFYCPIAYTFDGSSRMWYQRTPDNYVDRQSGWETISLPFEVEIVTTDKKGELTHFYQGSAKGHEYWLREFNGKDKVEGNVLTAKFESLKKAIETTEGDMTKTVNNTFLWDFFYNGLHSQQDDHNDEYQEYYNYSKDERKYEKYPRMAAGTPYLIGFPGETYYEFDLSGNFIALTTSSDSPDTLTVSRQVLTFASDQGAGVNVSAGETGASDDEYLFKTNYLNRSLTGNNWALTAKNNDGKSSFDKTPATATTETPAVTVWPFRPYFTTAPATSAPKLAITRIAISSNSDYGINDEQSQDKIGESLDIRSGKHKVIVTSNLKHTADVRIFNVGGLCIANFDIEPGQTIEHPIYHDGVYVVHAAGGRYRMKLAVK